jgi:uncharacterized protein YjbI with pentapeptide repeats
MNSADLSNADLVGARLNGVDLTLARLNGAKLEGADLNLAILNDATLDGTDLTNVNLNGVSFRGATLTQIKLKGSTFDGTDLRRADLSKTSLDGINLSGAEYNQYTKWPEGFNPVSVGAILDKINLDETLNTQTPSKQSIRTENILNDRTKLFDSVNPLRQLFEGPMDGLELVSHGLTLESTLSYSEMEGMVYNLALQFDEGKKPIVPQWWDKSPEQFCQEINENLASLARNPIFPLDNLQTTILEVLMGMWSEHFYG